MHTNGSRLLHGCPPRRTRGSLLTDGLMDGITSAAWAEKQTAAVRDDPAARIALVERCYRGPFGQARRHLPFRRAAMSFMHWQLRRGVLEPLQSSRPGSPWWRAVNERLLRDGCEAVALSGGLPGPASSRTVDYWTSFADRPTARSQTRAIPSPPPPAAARPSARPAWAQDRVLSRWQTTSKPI